MLCKCLEKKLSLMPDGNESESFVAFEIEYYLLESMTLEEADSPDSKTYGFEIIKKSGSQVEAESVKDFSTSRDKAISILNRLADNMVTPMYLYYVLDDLLAE